MSPTFSIIIPVYNQEQYLRQCLDSIIAQSFSNFEAILVDDGSSDNSGIICDEFAKKDSRITVIHKNNEGVSIARNRGLDVAKGEWVSFVDADDYAESNYLEVFNRIENKTDLTYFGNRWILNDGCGKIFFLPQRVYFGWDNIQEGILLLKQNCAYYDFYGYTWNKFFNNHIIQEHNIRFVPNLNMKEDEIFVDDFIIHSNSIALISDALYNYRWTGCGLTCSIKNTNCLNLYVNNSEKFLKKISNKSLRTYQISYIFDILIQTFNLNIKTTSRSITKRRILAFARTYKNECNFNIHSFGRTKWAFWNYYSNLKAKIYANAIYIIKRF